MTDKKSSHGYFNSRIMRENNIDQPKHIFHEWGRWRVVRMRHTDEKNNREQYVLQRFSDSKKIGKLWHMVAFFWSFEDMEEFITEMNTAMDKIESIDEDLLSRS